MNSFIMNGYLWHIRRVHPNSSLLIDRTDKRTVATTDIDEQVINLSSRLEGDFMIRVLLHELGHCALFSYGLLDELHEMVYPEYWVDAEELICNILADYGLKIFATAFKILGYDAWQLIPKEFDKLLAA